MNVQTVLTATSDMMKLLEELDRIRRRYAVISVEIARLEQEKNDLKIREMEIIQPLTAERDRLNALIEGEKDPLSPEEVLLSKTIHEFEWTIRTINCLKGENIYYVRDLLKLDYDDLLRVPNLGRKSINEIREVFASHGLTLGQLKHTG